MSVTKPRVVVKNLIYLSNIFKQAILVYIQSRSRKKTPNDFHEI